MLKKICVITFAMFTVILMVGSTSYGEETDTFTWRGVPVTEFPYYIVLHDPNNKMDITVNGKDILHGENVKGAEYKNGRLWLNNLNIDGDIYINDESFFNITLSGESNIKKLIFTGTELTIEGDGSLTAGSIQSEDTTYYEIKHYYASSTKLTIRENARVIGKDNYETASELNKAIKVNDVTVKNNGYLKCADISVKQLNLYDNAYISTEHCSANNIALADDSIMQVIGNYKKYPKLEITDDLKSCIYDISEIEISDNAKLSVLCDTTDYGIFCSGMKATSQITVSGNGILNVSGNSEYGIVLDQNPFGALDIYDNSYVTINGFNVALLSKRLGINGGTLKINSNENALQINQTVSDYSPYDTGLYINGDVVSQSSDWVLSQIELDSTSKLTLNSAETGVILKDFSITVKEKMPEK